MTTQALTKRGNTIGAVATTGLTREGIQIVKEQLDLLTELVTAVLVAGQDYGIVPGTKDKRTLFKPGAATVVATFNCYAQPHIERGEIDPSKGKHGFVAYDIRVDVISKSNGEVQTSGFGSCNSHEKKYRYRDQKRKCPQCGKEAIIKGREEYGGGWLCFKKQDGCGAKFGDGDSAIERQIVGQIENEDPLDIANTILKMATKRAEVDAAMRLPGVARFFTQDIGDDESDHTAKPQTAPPATPAAHPSPMSQPAAETQTVKPQAPPADAVSGPTLRSLGDLFNACQKEFGLKSIDTVVVLAAIAGKPVIAKDIQSVFGSFDAAFAAIQEDRSKMEQPGKFTTSI